MQRRRAGVIRRPQVRAVGQQQLHHPEIVLDARVRQRLRTALGMPGFDVGAVLQQESGDFEIAAPRHIVQRSGAHLVGLIDVRAAGDLLPDALEIAGLRRRRAGPPPAGRAEQRQQRHRRSVR